MSILTAFSSRSTTSTGRRRDPDPMPIGAGRVATGAAFASVLCATWLLDLQRMSVSPPGMRDITLPELLLVGDGFALVLVLLALKALCSRGRDEGATAARADAPVGRARDGLTGLATRGSFDAACRDAAETGCPATVMLVVLQGLDAVGANHGRADEERSLAVLARRLATVVDTADLPARFGPTTLAVLVRGIAGPEAARSIGDRIARALGEPVSLDRVEHRLTPVIGAASIRPGEDASAATARAVAALARITGRPGPAISYHADGDLRLALAA